MKIVPITLRDARAFQDEHHRHNQGAHAHKFSVALDRGGEIVGVATAGRPSARRLDDGRTLEITRVCVLDGVRNANSMLYGACIRAGRAMGYTRFVTYTLENESGASVKAVGFKCDGKVRENKDGWNQPSRPREMPEKFPRGKLRWILE